MIASVCIVIYYYVICIYVFHVYMFIMSPLRSGGGHIGHIVFGVDPVSVGGVAFCLHDIS